MFSTLMNSSNSITNLEFSRIITVEDCFKRIDNLRTKALPFLFKNDTQLELHKPINETKPTAVSVGNKDVKEYDKWEMLKKDIFASLNWEDLQVGYYTEIEDYIDDMLSQESRESTIRWIYSLALEDAKNTLLICTLLHALSHIDYEKVYPYGPMLAMTQLSHKDKCVVGYAIKAFSNWNSKHSLNYVENYSPSQTWAKREWLRVVNYIKENGDDLDAVFDEKDYTTKMDTGTGRDPHSW